VASVVPYAVAFGALPAFVTLGLPGHPWPPGWAVGAAALLGSGAHFVNTLPDLASDIALGVRGLPQRLGPRWSLLVGAGLLAASAGLVALAPAGRPGSGELMLLGSALVAVAAVVATAATGRSRAAWSLTLVAAGLTVALFLVEGGSLAA
jgi:4-hydroxybenzoate polyprenyltransferase